MRTRPIHSSPWAPLRHGVYRTLWAAQLASNVGTFMQTVGAVWLMGTIGGTTTLVALVQTALYLPVFIVGLPAGALADVVDRRRLLIATQTGMLVAAGALGILTWTGNVTPFVLLALTFALGVGSALNTPPWQSIQPDLVPPDEFPQAIALGSASANLGRSVGPALGGLLVAVAGPQAVFLVNSALFVPVVTVLQRWRPQLHTSPVPPERLSSAMRTGLRYVRYSPILRSILIREFAVTVPVSAIVALLPIVARDDLGMDAVGYGVLLGCFGAGGVVSMMVIPRFRARFDADSRLVVSCLCLAATTLAVATIRSAPLLGAALVVGGGGWLLTWSTFQVAAQRALPGWIRARGMGLYFLTFQGGTAIGSALFGALADATNLTLSLLLATSALIASLGLKHWWPVAGAEDFDLTAAPDVAATYSLPPETARGPVLVTVSYEVAMDRHRDFAQAMKRVQRMRSRLGAFNWGLFQDPAEPQRFLETYLVESWIDYVRQRRRLTVNDLLVERTTDEFLAPGTATVASQFPSAFS